MTLLTHAFHRWFRLTRLMAVTGAIGICMFGIFVLGLDVVRKIENLATAKSDNVLWALSQVEVEFLHLDHAMEVAKAEGVAELPELRLWFDIFYSRIDTVRSSRMFTNLRGQPEFAQAVQVVWVELEALLPLIDGSNADLLAGLGRLNDTIHGLQEPVRVIGLHGLTFFAEQSDATRNGIAETLTRVSALIFILIVALLAMVLVLWRLYRVSQDHARDARLAADRMTTVVSTALDAVIVADKSGRILEFNRAAEGIFGYTRAEVLDRSIGTKIVPPHLRAAHDAGMNRMITTGQSNLVGKGRIKLDAMRKDGSVFPVELSVSSARSEAGDMVFVSFLRDITQRLAAEKELRAARDAALDGERAKAELLAVMSHEMRTPLNGILGTLDLLEDTHLDEKQRTYLNIINKSGNLLLHHVNDVLDIARLESRKMEIERAALNLTDVVRDVVDGQLSVAAQSGNRLSVVVPPREAGWVIGDAVRLKQVLLNLVGNAIKFTQNGQVSVEAERLADGDMVEFRVIDTGQGINAKDLDRVFDDFVTLDASYGRETTGTGLGLGIARRFAKAMDGDIGAESELGEGSLFWLRLPMPRCTAPAGAETDRKKPKPAPRPKAPQQKSLRILVVEDNQVNRIVVHDMLKSMGHQVTVACDGREGVQQAQKTTFDLILMDISMPRMDGVEATRTIRAQNGTSSSTPIFALTAHALPQEIARFKDVGMARTLTKPISRQSLSDALSHLDPKPGQAPDTAMTKAARAESAIPLCDQGQLSALREELGDDGTRRLMKSFIDEGDATLGLLRETQPDADNLSDIGTKLHKLAGSAAMFGAARLHQQLGLLESHAKRGEHQQLATHLPGLDSLWTDTRSAYLDQVSLGETPESEQLAPF